VRDVLTRGYEAADAPALAELMNLIEEHAGGRPCYLADELQELISALVRDPARDSSMLFGPGGELVAAGFTTTPPAGGHRIYLTGGVHPRWRGRGIGRAVLGRHLARAMEIHDELAPDAAWTAESRTPLGGEDAARLYRRFGMTPLRYWFEMAAPTAGAAALAVPPGVRVAAYSAEHEVALYSTHMEAFADNWGHQQRDLASWVALTVRSTRFLPELSRLAFEGGELIGYVLTYRHPEPDRVYVGHVGVRRPWRKRGLAGAMLADVLAAAGRAGYKQVALDVDADSPTGAVGVYERVGFAVELSSVSYSIPIGDRPHGAPATAAATAEPPRTAGGTG
jgi:mycothiol synthase